MQKYVLITMATFLLTFGSVNAQHLPAKVSGVVVDDQGPIEFATAVLIQDGKVVTGMNTDEEGNFRFDKLDPGIYKLQVSWAGIKTHRQLILAPGEREVIRESIIIGEEPRPCICGGDPLDKRILNPIDHMTFDQSMIENIGR